MSTTKAQRDALLRFRAQQPHDPNRSTTLEFKCSASRGRNTYGYNIVTLYADGVKVARTMGGGYDMQGTVLGDYIQERFQAELLAVRDRADYAYRATGEPRYFKTKNLNALYGMAFYESYKDEKTGKGVPAQVVLDGATGFSSMERIIEAIGWHLSNMRTTGRNIYILAKD